MAAIEGEVDMFPPEGFARTYRMRGYDTTLTSFVFWDSDYVDAGATDYSGPGPVTNVVLQKKFGD